MISFSDVELQELAKVCVLANTPDYVFRNYRDLPFVRALSLKESPRSLIDFALQEIGRKEMPFDAAVQVYASIVALRFSEPFPNLSGPEIEELSQLRWARELFDLAGGRPENVSRSSANAIVVGSQVTASNSSTSALVTDVDAIVIFPGHQEIAASTEKAIITEQTKTEDENDQL